MIFIYRHRLIARRRAGALGFAGLVLWVLGLCSPDMDAAQRPDRFSGSLSEFGALADCWALGRVDRLHSSYREGGIVCTTVDLGAVTWWRRGEAGDRVRFVVAGGRLGQEESRTVGARRWRLSEWVLVGLKRNREGEWILLQGERGVFPLQDYRPELGKGLVLIDRQVHPFPLKPLTPLDTLRRELEVQ